MTNSTQLTVASSPETIIERLQRAAAAHHEYRFTHFSLENTISFTFEKVTSGRISLKQIQVYKTKTPRQDIPSRRFRSSLSSCF